jgi:SAM-dependent MidA family methyltransferase
VSQPLKPGRGQGESAEFINHPGVDGRVGNYPAPAIGVLPSGLELRLDQGHHPSSGSDQGFHRRKDLSQGDERTVGYRQIERHERCRKMAFGQMAGIQSLVDPHPWVLPKFPGELTLSNIDGIHRGDTVLQEAIGESAGRRSEVEGPPTGYLQLEGQEGMFEFEAAAAHVPFAGLEDDLFVEAHLAPGFIGALSIQSDHPSQDGALRLFAALAKTQFHESLIQSHGVDARILAGARAFGDFGFAGRAIETINPPPPRGARSSGGTPTMTEAERRIRDEIRENGPLPFSRFMALALYAPEGGYYESSNRPIGRHGDFYTSVSTGPVFGRLLATRFANWLSGFDGADLVEAGAHDGQLAVDLLQALESEPRLLERLCYWILEPSPVRRRVQAERLVRWKGRVQWRTSWLDLDRPVRGIIVANELLDAMPCARFGWNAAERSWFEWSVTVESDRLAWVRTPGRPSWWSDLWKPLETVLPDGYVVEESPDAIAWWRGAADQLERGWLVTLDYGDADGPRLRPERTCGTLRAYHRHQVSEDLLARPGEQDLTAHVNFAGVIEAGESAGLETLDLLPQGRWLGRIAAEVLASGGERADWLSRHSRQLQTLIHPGHLGQSFKVLVQARAASGDRPI